MARKPRHDTSTIPIVPPSKATVRGGKTSCPIPGRFVLQNRLLFIVPMLSLLVLSPPASAMRGRFDFREFYQRGRSGSQVYDNRTRNEEGYLHQNLTFRRAVRLDAEFRAVRESTDSELNSVRNQYESVTYRPLLSIGYRTRRLGLGADATGVKRTFTSSGIAPPGSRRFQIGSWIRIRPREAALVEGRWLGLRSWQEVEAGNERERQEETGSVNTEYVLGDFGRIGYRFSSLTSKVQDSHIRTSQIGHTFDFRGSGRFDDRRGEFDFRARSRLFHQETVSGEASVEEVYMPPFEGGVVLDDTPEIYDPLEDELEAVPALADGDRAEPTGINIGDSAPPVREFGGDYRNIEYDFGDTTNLAGGFLYVDRTLLNPEFFQWRLFVSNDPDGRVWEELDEARTSVTYQELGTGLQGWEITLPEGLAARFFKMVDSKIGPTVPDLFITELEVFSAETTGVLEFERDSRNHVIDAGLGYNLTAGWKVSYNTRLRSRFLTKTEDDVFEQAHGFSSRWALGTFTVHGGYEIQRQATGNDLSSDIDLIRASIARRRLGGFSTSLSWSRTMDRSSGRDRISDASALSFTGYAAPGLRIGQRFSYGTLTDRGVDLESTSITAATSIMGRPVPSLSINLERTDRWVDHQASTGFQRFNDTVVTVDWKPVPLINLSSHLRYLVREEEEWLVRNTASWSPVPGGAMEVRFSGNHLYDTRTETTQLNARVNLLWWIRQNFRTEGTLEAVDYRGVVENTSPINGNYRITWQF